MTRTSPCALLAAFGLAGAALLLTSQHAKAATITVTTQNDLFAAGPSGCSLRRAINAANNNSDFNGCVGVGPYGNDIIVFDPSIVTATLSINTGGGDNDSNSYRDLDLGGTSSDPLTIQGPPGGVAIVAGAGLNDRVFDVSPFSSGDITLTNLVIVSGTMPATTYETGSSNDACYQGGGGIRHRGSGRLTLINVRVEDNAARTGGGLCHQSGSLRVIGSVIQRNATQGRDGGGIYSSAPTVISTTRVLSNTAIISETTAHGGGGVYHSPGMGNGTLEIADSSVSFNVARRINTIADEAHGGGIVARAITTLTQVTVFSNTLASVSTNALGGGIYSDGRLEATFTDVISNLVTATHAYGGGVSTVGGPATLVGGRILSNSARYGGGWYNLAGNSFLFAGEVRFNQATRGGGIESSAPSAGVTAVEVCDNRATTGAGGGILVWANSMSVQDTRVCDNQAQSGGGIYVANIASLSLVRSAVINNSANSTGGGLYAGDAVVNIENSGVTSNTAISGGGLFAVGTRLSVLNSTFSSNSGSFGAGVSIQGASATAHLTYTTVASNTGFGFYLSSGATASLRAVLLAQNTAGNCVSSSATFISANDNLSSDTSCAALTAPNDLTGADPLLRPLAFLGSAPAHLLMPNSPALNRIPATRCVPGDQRGVSRPKNGACDVGAVEMVLWRAYHPVARTP